MDKYRLMAEVKRNGYTQDEFCATIGMSRSAFYRKCNGISEFTQGEIEKILTCLGLNSPMGIFFAEKVS